MVEPVQGLLVAVMQPDPERMESLAKGKAQHFLEPVEWSVVVQPLFGMLEAAAEGKAKNMEGLEETLRVAVVLPQPGKLELVAEG